MNSRAAGWYRNPYELAVPLYWTGKEWSGSGPDRPEGPSALESLAYTHSVPEEMLDAAAVARAARRREEDRRRAEKPRLGGWVVAVVLLGWIGGLIGFLVLKDEEPERAKKVAIWGVIWSAIAVLITVLFYVVVILLIV